MLRRKPLQVWKEKNKSQIAQPFILRMICLVPAIPFTEEIQNDTYPYNIYYPKRTAQVKVWIIPYSPGNKK
jgi:hypothetical protein